MMININPCRIYILIFLIGIFSVFYAFYSRVIHIKKPRYYIIHYSPDDNFDNNVTYNDLIEQRFNEKRKSMRHILRTKRDIKHKNIYRKIFNMYLGPIDDETIIIVIHVHANVFYLSKLVEQLKQVTLIHKTLLIFCHDYHDYEINKIINKIIFAKYMQIFYPYSTQLHPYVFPGYDNKTCGDDFVCIDSNVRDPILAQQKHFWWWQFNQIFDHLQVTDNYHKTILFIQDDNYVTEDFLYIYTMLQSARDKDCQFCEFISLAPEEPDLAIYKFERWTDIKIQRFKKDVLNLGIAFDKHTWQKIKTKAEEFCRFDDCDWDNCVRYVANKRPEGTAPSGAHTEPWTFVVVQDTETKAAIQEIVEEEEEINYSKRMSRQWVTDLKPFATKPVKPYLSDAPALVLVYRQSYSWRPDGKKRMHYYSEISTAIAAGVLLTAIQYCGLVALTSTPLNCNSRLRNLLSRPGNERLELLFPVGRPHEDATVPDLQRKSLDEIMIKI